ncbi:Blue-light-activated protein [Anatilimnocola aggregata]|uniref:histidine kinase n=1 Tax=Anatilimnocola aggregata TaxID=2528021 RepID=A0A517Y509_9BACT|nr:Blue-light-activated protein [Anatilimnocola aggregata]
MLFTLHAENGQFGGINWISPNIETLLGYRAGEVLGGDWFLGNIHPEDREAVVNPFFTEIVRNNYFSAEYRFRHKDGSHRWIRGEIRLLRNAAGQPAEAIGSLADITQRKQLEDQFRQAQKMEVVGHLAGGIAHDFNNVLAVILGCCQFLENDVAVGGESRELVEEIYKAANRAASLTKQLLAFSRQQILRPMLLNLNEVVTEAVAMLDRLIGEDITVKTSLQSRLWPVKVDGGQMNQVIMNLAVNARDAMPQGGTLTIETSNVELDETYAQSHREVTAGSYVMLVVSDTGSGMDEQTKSRIFEPFFTTKETGKGTGLGLATVFGIVKQSEGHVTVDSELGTGTTFKVYLPRHETAATSEDATKVSTSAPRGTETILVAEDEEMLLKLASRILSSQGYAVLQAGDGEEALQMYRAHAGPIHLLLADVVMPKMSGRQLYDQLSAIQPGLKVLFMSGYTDDAVLRHGVLESTTNFLEKPFTYAALSTCVRRALDAM